ncbi:MAG: hypothetical protein K0U74_03175 [Alphaproteobacteria bacterium]|nr:hypothetical protein [Alphaproteobacteria bacterium]
MRFPARLEAAVTSGVLATLFLVALLSEYLEKLVKLPSGWENAMIFLALLSIVRLLGTIIKIDQDMQLLIRQSGVKAIEKYETYEDFYHDLSQALKAAKRSLDLTHIRPEPPSSFRLGAAYFDSIEAWCEKNPAGSVRRIISLENQAMQQWGQELLVVMQRHPNFRARACDRRATFPMINMAIVDERVVFLAITADSAERTSGIRINDERIAAYFLEYYNNIWSKSRGPR